MSGDHFSAARSSLLVEAAESLAIAPVVVRYESMVADPQQEIRGLCSRLGIEFVPGMIEYGTYPPLRGTVGDRWGQTKHAPPEPASAEGWVLRLWPWFNEYLQLLGRDVVERLGYDFPQLSETVQQRKPKKVPSVPSLSSIEFRDSGHDVAQPRSVWWRLGRSLQLRGPKDTVKVIAASVRRTASRKSGE